MTLPSPSHTRDIIAAQSASEAITELLRYERKGPAGATAFGDGEVIDNLCIALVQAIDIEIENHTGALESDMDRLAQIRWAIVRDMEHLGI